jgi:dihydroorotase/N-acyl-D-amino-acid deacylase
MSEEVVARFMALPFAMIGSDGMPRGGMPHPRLYGTFPRVIRRFVRELKVLTLEEAVAKMTGLPARRLGLTNAGVIRKGCRADLTLFDPDRFADTATFDAPRQSPDGLTAVVIGGEIVFENGAMTGLRPGGFLRAGG